jgi:hypothetical protein
MGFPQFFGIIASLWIADYFLQSKEMAIKKAERSREGLVLCLRHCNIYAIFTTLLVSTSNTSIIQAITVYIIAFVTHFAIDRYYLAQKWLDIIKGRNFFEEYQTLHKKTPQIELITIPFACIVYVIVDNGMHIMAMWYILSLFEYLHWIKF